LKKIKDIYYEVIKLINIVIKTMMAIIYIYKYILKENKKKECLNEIIYINEYIYLNYFIFLFCLIILCI